MLKNTQYYFKRMIFKKRIKFKLLNKNININSKTISNLKKALKKQQFMLNKIAKENDFLAAQLAQSQKKLSGETERCESLVQQLEIAQNAYASISGAFFWRITKPARTLTDKLKYHFRKNEAAHLIWKACKYFMHFGFTATCRKGKEYYQKRQQEKKIIHLERVREVKDYKELCKLFSNSNRKGFLLNKLEKYDKIVNEKVLVVTHELNLTGAPIAALHFAASLKTDNYLPVVISPTSGVLSDEYVKLNIPVLICPDIFTSDISIKIAKLFNIALVNTIVSAPFINSVMYSKIQIIWWIHEARASYTEENMREMPKFLPSNVHVYTVGAYAYQILKIHFPQYQVRNLLYYVPDSVNKGKKETFVFPNNAKNKKILAVVGMLEYRKGQDILVDAIFSLPEEILHKCFFVFVGKQCYEFNYQKIMTACRTFPRNCLYIEQLLPEEMQQFYQSIDHLICCSRDDPMPIVVAEAMQFSKPVICSENTGSATIVREYKCGFVYGHDDARELAASIVKFAQKIDENNDMRHYARQAYERYFSKTAFKAEAKKTMSFITSSDNLTFSPMQQFLSDFADTCNRHDYILLKNDLLSFKNIKNKKILLISHEFSYTGAPIVLHTLAKKLQSLGNSVLICSPIDGPLAKAIADDGIPVAVYGQLYSNNFLQNNAKVFDLVILNTIVTFRAIEQLRNIGIPIAWWIHDSEASYSMGGFADILPRNLPPMCQIYCGGVYAQNVLLKYYPEYTDNVKILNYYCPDKLNTSKDFPVYPLHRKKDRMIFTILGQQDTRKGHDIFAQAIILLTEAERQQAEFFFFGKPLDSQIKKSIDNVCSLFPDSVHYIEEIDREALFSVYLQSNCIVCSSRDDPMPVFVTEAMMMKKIIICSEYTGTAAILRSENCGLIYYDNSPQELADCIRTVLYNHNTMQPMCERARQAYLRYFSEESFSCSVSTLLHDMFILQEKFTKNDVMSTSASVSVIIPTYQGGVYLRRLFDALTNQKKVGAVEIVVVDSGSEDNTCAICEEYRVNLHKITQKEFSHSYARNLGARNAHGDILIFMTQDALPSSDTWILEMISPIVNGEATAVSCREQCPSSTELYYQVSSWHNSTFLGIQESDQLNILTGKETPLELRAKAALNDVSTAIGHSNFTKHLYRFSYAEDLDLGLRLLREGHKIKLLSKTYVEHGHNRKIGYYLKRGYVETQSLAQIDPMWAPTLITADKICYEIVQTYFLIKQAIKTSKENLPIQYEIEREAFLSIIFTALASASKEMIGTRSMLATNDETFNRVLTIVAAKSLPCVSETELFGHICYYTSSVLAQYLRTYSKKIISQEDQVAFYDCLLKQFALMSASLLASSPPDDPLSAQLQFLTQGV